MKCRLLNLYRVYFFCNQADHIGTLKIVNWKELPSLYSILYAGIRPIIAFITKSKKQKRQYNHFPGPLYHTICKCRCSCLFIAPNLSSNRKKHIQSKQCPSYSSPTNSFRLVSTTVKNSSNAFLSFSFSQELTFINSFPSPGLSV